MFFVRRDEYLDDPPDLLVAADDRVELVLLGGLGEIGAEALQRFVLLLGRLVGDAARPADFRERRGQPLGRDPHASQLVGRPGGRGRGERQQQVLGRDVLVAQLAGFALGRAQHRQQLGTGLRDRVRRRGGVGDRQLAQRALDPSAQAVQLGPQLCQQRQDHAAGGIRARRRGRRAGRGGEQRGEQVQRGYLRVAALLSQTGGGRKRLLGLDRETIRLHVLCPLRSIAERGAGIGRAHQLESTAVGDGQLGAEGAAHLLELLGQARLRL